jgi:4-hydroxy-2-oxoheptanedioate aldolase
MTPDQHPLGTRLPALLRSGQPLRGIFNGIPSPALVEMWAYAGFDFIVIDNEHGLADFGMTEHLLRAARASGIAALVRCFVHDLPRGLDMGAAGVQLPMVHSAEQAARLVSRVRYPRPDGSGGQRSNAFSTRAAGYGAFGGPAHTRLSNGGIALVVMVETPEAWPTRPRSLLPRASTRSLSAPTTWPTRWATRTAGMTPGCRLPSSRCCAPLPPQAAAPACWP